MSTRIAPRIAGAGLLAMTLSASLGAQAAPGRVNRYGYPEKHAPQPTAQPITPADLMTRLYIFADDSMQGRQFGRIGNMKGTNYIAGEVKKLGLLPMGDSGTFFQRLPMRQRHFTDKSSITVEGQKLAFNTDFVPTPTPIAPKAINNAPVIFGGSLGDSASLIAPSAAAGKVVVLLPAAQGGAGGGRGGGGGGGRGGAGAPANACVGILAGGGRGAGGGGGGGRGLININLGAGAPINPVTYFADAVGIVIVDLDITPVGRRAIINMPGGTALGTGTRSPRAPIVYTQNGQIATIENGQVAGKLPAGMTAASVQQMIDSIRTDSIGRVQRTNAFNQQETVRACEIQDSIAVSHGATSMRPAGGAGAGAAGANAPAPGAGRGGAGGGGAAGGGGGGRGAGGGGRGGAGGPAPTVSIRMTSAAAAKLFGRPVEGMAPGTAGKPMTASLDFEDRDVSDWARNVVAMVPGSDPVLKNQYVLVSAHNDHVGFGVQVADHDSLKYMRDLLTRMQLSKRPGDLGNVSAQELAAAVGDSMAIKRIVDSLHRIRPARKDSINNGADDDGSGSMAILEIAEFIAKMPVKPKRSILFVWQTGEEAGLNGSAYFAAHPTVPIDSIVADINIDMIGRGRSEDIPGGGPNYVAVVGSGFLSKELAEVVAATNMKQKMPLNLDPKFDLPTSWPNYNNIYGRSDHYNYARQCIPIAFFFTGLHGDYHQRTDEPQYIDYPHYSMITNYVKDVVVDLGTRNWRPNLDKPCSR